MFLDLIFTGEQIFYKTSGGVANDQGFSLSSTNSDSECFVTGFINLGQPNNNAVDFTGDAVNGSNQTAFIAKLGETGQQQFYKTTGSRNAQGYSTVASSDGGCFIAGFIDTNFNPVGPTGENDPKDFDGNIFIGNDNLNIFVAKLNSAGNQVFYKRSSFSTNIRATEENLILSIEVISDSEGGCFVGGRLPRPTTSDETYFDFAENSFTGYSKNDAFISRLGPTGNQIFYLRSATLGSSNTTNISLALSPDKSCFITGNIIGGSANSIDFNNSVINSLGTGDNCFVAKISPTGEQLFFKTAFIEDNGSNTEVDNKTYNIISTPLNGCIVSGPISSAGTDFFGNPTNQSLGIFVALFNVIGVQEFFNVSGFITDVTTLQYKSGGSRLNLIDNNNFLITGSITVLSVDQNLTELIDFNDNTIFTETGSTQNLSIIFTAKIDFNGNQTFYKIIKSAQELISIKNSVEFISYNSDVVVNNDESIFISGFITTGENIETRDFNDNLYTSGYKERDIFIAKLDSAGNQLFLISSGSLRNDQSFSMSSDNNNGVFITGYINTQLANNPSFDFENNPIPEILTQNQTIFVSKLISNIFVYGITIEDINLGTFQTILKNSIVDSSELGLAPNTIYYWDNFNLTTSPTNLLVGKTTENNKLIVQLEQINAYPQVQF